jgi:hypothetical protein
MGIPLLTPSEESARDCGLRLLDVSEVYERGMITPEAGPQILSVVGLVARQRRFLRAAYLLADEGLRLEAGLIIRAMLEFFIRQQWLQADPELNHRLWARDDLRARMLIDTELRGLEVHPAEVMEDDTRDAYQRQLERLDAELELLREERGLARAPTYPNLREQAETVGLGQSYSLAYRFDSLTASHPTALAIEQLLEETPEGIRVLPEPPPGRGYADPYGVGAAILRGALGSAASLFPELDLPGIQ